MLRKVLKGSILTGLGIGAVSVLEYVYFIFVANVLSPDEFGRLNTVVAVLTILLAMATVGIGTSVAKFVAEREAVQWRSQCISSGLVVQLLVAGVVMGLLVGVAVASTNTRFDDMTDLLLLLAGFFPVLALAAMLPYGFLGLERIVSYNFATAINVALRVLAVGPLVYFHAGAAEALVAFFFGGGATVLFCTVGLRGYIRRKGIRHKLAQAILRYSAPATLSGFLVIFLARADVVMLKALLHDETNLIVAQYSAPATLARGVFYLSSAVAIALLPAVSRAGRIPFAALGRLMLVLSALLLGTAALASRFGAAIVTLLFPQELGALSYLLPDMVVAMAVLSLAHLLGTVLIASGRPGASAVAFVLGFAVFLVSSLVLVPERSVWTEGGVETLGLGADGIVIALTAGAAVAFLVAFLWLIRLRAAPTEGSLDWSSTLIPMIDGGP